MMRTQQFLRTSSHVEFKRMLSAHSRMLSAHSSKFAIWTTAEPLMHPAFISFSIWLCDKLLKSFDFFAIYHETFSDYTKPWIQGHMSSAIYMRQSHPVSHGWYTFLKFFTWIRWLVPNEWKHRIACVACYPVPLARLPGTSIPPKCMCGWSLAYLAALKSAFLRWRWMHSYTSKFWSRLWYHSSEEFTLVRRNSCRTTIQKIPQGDLKGFVLAYKMCLSKFVSYV